MWKQTAETAAIDEFYKTISSISFVLLGLWWVVLEHKYAERARDSMPQRHAYGIMLFFLLPGVTALISGINSELKLLWQIAFGLTGAIGIAEVLLYMSSTAIKKRGATALRWCGFVLYLLIIVFAVWPQLAQTVALGLTVREIEALLLSLLVVVGVHIAWFGLVETGQSAEA